MTYEQTEQAAREAASTLIDAVNGISPERVGEAIFDVLARSHRTLQQSLVSALKVCIEKYADQPDNCIDLRNEAARAWAQEVRRITDTPSRTMPGRLPLL